MIEALWLHWGSVTFRVRIRPKSRSLYDTAGIQIRYDSGIATLWSLSFDTHITNSTELLTAFTRLSELKALWIFDSPRSLDLWTTVGRTHSYGTTDRTGRSIVTNLCNHRQRSRMEEQADMWACVPKAESDVKIWRIHFGWEDPAAVGESMGIWWRTYLFIYNSLVSMDLTFSHSFSPLLLDSDLWTLFLRAPVQLEASHRWSLQAKVMPSRVRSPIDEGDPLTLAIAPPPDETAGERETRLRKEAQAKKVSDAIDEELERQRLAERRGPKPVRVLLLGMMICFTFCCYLRYNVATTRSNRIRYVVKLLYGRRLLTAVLVGKSTTLKSACYCCQQRKNYSSDIPSPSDFQLMTDPKVWHCISCSIFFTNISFHRLSLPSVHRGGPSSSSTSSAQYMLSLTPWPASMTVLEHLQKLPHPVPAHP